MKHFLPALSGQFHPPRPRAAPYHPSPCCFQHGVPVYPALLLEHRFLRSSQSSHRLLFPQLSSTLLFPHPHPPTVLFTRDPGSASPGSSPPTQAPHPTAPTPASVLIQTLPLIPGGVFLLLPQGWAGGEGTVSWPRAAQCCLFLPHPNSAREGHSSVTPSSSLSFPITLPKSTRNLPHVTPSHAVLPAGAAYCR